MKSVEAHHLPAKLSEHDGAESESLWVNKNHKVKQKKKI
jgi:hypothetical protein